MQKDLTHHSEAEWDPAGLAAEARSLGKQLVGTEPPEMVLKKYIEAHTRGLIKPDPDRDRFERIILAIAKTGPFFYPAQVYSAVFHRTGLLWKKIILLAAILECMPDTAAVFDEPESESRLTFFFGLSARSLAFVLTLLITTPVFLPLQVLLRSSGQQLRKAS